MNAKKLFFRLVAGSVVVGSLVMVGCVNESPKVQRVAIVELANVTSTSIDCQVRVDPNGASTVVERGVLYDTRDWKGEKVIKFEGSDDTFSVKIENLLPGCIYCVRAYARTEQGVVYSPISSTFTPIAEGSVADVEGNIYKTIRIGKQEWMVENLRTTKFNTGASISKPAAAGSWLSNTTGAYIEYTGKTDIAMRGYLYNGSAVLRKDGSSPMLPPQGWRVPSVEDWKTFQEHLILHAYGTEDDEDAVGIALAGNTVWGLDSIPIPGTIGFDLNSNNKTGFNAFPAGYRYRSSSSSAPFAGDALATCFWSSTPVAKPVGTPDPLFYYAKLSYDKGQLLLDDKTFNDKNAGACHRANGLSVRCMRDAQ